MDKNELKIYNWNAELAPGENGKEEVEVSFRIKGINKSNIFVAAFQAGKSVIEGIQGNGSFTDYMVPLMNLVFLVVNALKKSK